MILGVGCDPPWGPDWVTARVELPWNGRDRMAVLVNVPHDGWPWTIKALPPASSFREVSDVLSAWRGKQILERMRQRSELVPVQVRGRAASC